MKTKTSDFFNLCNIYILLWLINFIQALFITSSFVSLMFSVPTMLITMYCYVKTITSFRLKGAILAYSILFSVFLLYGLIALIFGDEGGAQRHSFLLMTLVSLGPIFAFYYFTKMDFLDAKKMTFLLFVFLAVAIAHYYDVEKRALAKLMEKKTSVDEIVNNASYYILGLFPFVFLLKRKPLIQYAVIGIILFYVLAGMKRGAMVVSGVLLVWFVYKSNQFATKQRKVLYLVLTVVFIIIGYRYIIQFFNNSDLFQQRMEDTIEGESSGRDWIYTSLWEHFINNNNIFQILFGEGANATVKISTMSAHNDWLEILIDFGFITAFIYLLIYVSFIRDLKLCKRVPTLYSMTGACLVYAMVRSLFSMSVTDMPFLTSMAIGFCLGSIDNLRKNRPVVFDGCIYE